MSVYIHKKTGEKITEEKIFEMIKLYGSDANVVINSVDLSSYRGNPFEAEANLHRKIYPYRALDIPFSKDFEKAENGLSQDDLVDIIYYLPPSRIKDKVYRTIREARNK